MPPLLSAIILNYRTPKDAVQCAQSLLKQTMANRMEIFVVDNHSCDDSVGVLRNRLGEEEAVRIIENPANLGFGAGNNRAQRYASGEFILIVNPDTEVEPDGLERLIDFLRKNEDVGIVAPKLVFPDGTIRDSYRTFPTVFDIVVKRTFLKRFFPGRLRRYLQHEKDPIFVHDTDWVVGACMVLRRDFYEELRGFDERFFLFFEDTDLCRRCREKGKRVVYFPDVRAKDRKQRLSGGDFLSLITKRTGRAHVISAFRYFRKWKHI